MDSLLTYLEGRCYSLEKDISILLLSCKGNQDMRDKLVKPKETALKEIEMALQVARRA